MEKITLKPLAKELLYKADEVNTHVDVISYSGTNAQERGLGSLYLVGHVKYGEEEDMGYVLSLISSLAKREYYSEAAVKSQNPRQAFEQTLKKLNEVLEDFFKNQDFALNLGLASVAGEQIYISKLGKFKVSLAREGQYIDVLNNINLFQKSAENEQQFSNVISGSLQPGDKFFAYYPARCLTSREKTLQGTLIKENQEQFSEKIGELATTANAFSCCGVHIAIEQIKEIPLETVPQPRIMTASAPATAPMPAMPPVVSTETTPKPVQPVASEKTKVIAAELSVSNKSNMLSGIRTAAAKLPRMNRLPIKSKFRGFVVIALLVLVPIVTIAIVRAGGDSSEAKAAYKFAVDNLQLAQEKLAKNDIREARALLYDALGHVGTLDSKNVNTVRTNLNESLDSLDRVIKVTPTQLGTLPQDTITAIGEQDILRFAGKLPSVWYNHSELLTITDQAGKTTTITLKDPASATDAALYQDNLYVLSGNNIYKYTGALKGSTTRTNWGTITAQSAASLAVDGNIYVLDGQGKITTYFKGEQKGGFDTNIPMAADNRLYTNDSKTIWLASVSEKHVYLFDKESGALQSSYRIDFAGDLRDIAVDDSGTIFILGKDNNLWAIPPQS